MQYVFKYVLNMYLNKLHIKSSSLCFSAILLNTVCGGYVTGFCQYINIFVESLHYGAARERSMICMVASLKNHYVIHLKSIILSHYVYLT